MNARVGMVAMLVGVTLTADAQGVSHRAPLPRAAPKPLPAPPTLPHVRVDVARDHVLVTEDLVLRRGAWSGGEIDAFVAYGAPGLPRAMDARLYPGANEDDDAPRAGDPFEPVPLERAARRPGHARLLLGPGSMAGAVLHLREALFRRATAATGAAWLRVRTLMDLPTLDATGEREVLVRLGVYEGEPYALDVIEVAAADARSQLARVDARLCGPDADRWPLAVEAAGAALVDVGEAAPIAPVSSVRHATDDLCIRFRLASDGTVTQRALGS